MKTSIQNRKGMKVAVEIEESPQSLGLAFVMHGLGGFKEQPHIRAMAEAFKEKGLTVVTFDTTNSIGESDGKYEDGNTTSYYADLEDVIAWSSQQKWYKEPFYLAGHSLGGICVALFAEKHPERVKGLAPISTVVSGKLSMESREERGGLGEWKRTGWKIAESKSKPGVIKKLPWSEMEDRLRYDLLPDVNKLTMPVLLVVGEKDEGTPPEHQKILFDALPGLKELHIIKSAPHTFREPAELKKLKSIFLRWIEKTEGV